MTRSPEVTLHLVEFEPTHAPLHTSRGAHLGRPTLLFGITSPGGEVWSEACPLPGFGGGEDHVDLARSELSNIDAGLLATWLGQAPLDALDAAFDRAAELRSAAARHALEWLLVEAVARQVDRSPAELVQAWLARRAPSAWPGPRQVLRTSAVLDLLHSDLDAQAERLFTAGISTFKLKCGQERSREEQALEELARLDLPIRVRLDPGCAWTLDQALDFVRGALRICRASQLSLEFVEDPTSDPSEWDELAQLAPIAADEVLAQAGAREPPRDASSFWVLKPMVHGVSRLLGWAERGRRQGQKLVVSHSFDGPWALRAATELGCALQVHEHAAGLGAHLGLEAWGPHLLARGERLRGSLSGPADLSAEFLLDGGHLARVLVGPCSPRRSSAAYGDRVSLDFAEQRVTFAALAAALPEPRKGSAPAFVPVIAEPNERAISELLAALEHGVPALLLHPSSTEASRRTLVERCQRHQAELLPGDAVIVPTSGSTAEPQLVVHTHASLRAAIGASAARLGAPTPSTRWLLSLPFAHVGGLSILLRCLVGGACVVARPLPKAPHDVEVLLGEAQVTHLSVVPTQLARWLDDPSFTFPSCVECVLVGGAEASEELRARARERKVPARYSYGLTEMGSQVMTELPRAAGVPAPRGSVGSPLVSVSVRLGANGCLEVGGPMLMRRYLGAPTPLNGGLLVTSDLGRLEADGTIALLGRADDLIISGGENVTPVAVESALGGVAGVRELAALGRPSAEWGQEVTLAVVLASDGEPTRVLEQLRQRAEAELPPFARPKSYYVVPALPLLDSGKLDRRRLAGELAALKIG